MTVRDLFEFAWTALTRHRVRTLLCVLGVAVGVTAVLALTALGEGARLFVVREFTGIGSNLVIILPGKTETTGAIPGFGGVPHDLTIEDARVLQRDLRLAQYVVPVSVGTETVSHGERRRQVAVVGSTSELLDVRELKMRAGSFLPPSESHRGAPLTVLGHRVAQELFPGQNPVGRVVRIAGWRMRVIGVLAERGTHVGLDMDEIVVVPVATGMRMFNRSSLFRILMKARSAHDAGAVCKRAVTVLTERHREEDVTCITQDAVVSTFSSILQALTLALAAIGGISLTVAGIGIMNVMLVAVSERTEEVGLLQALGARRAQILAVFLTEAILLALIGGLTGVIVGWGAVKILVALYPALPASPPAWAILSALAVSLVLGTIFGVLPARRASKLDPVDALERR